MQQRTEATNTKGTTKVSETDTTAVPRDEPTAELYMCQLPVQMDLKGSETCIMHDTHVHHALKRFKVMKTMHMARNLNYIQCVGVSAQQFDSRQ